MESTAQHAVHHVVGRDQRRLAVVGALAMGAQRLGQRVAQALFVRAALRRGNGVAIGVDKGIDLRRPGNGPFDGALAVAVLGAAREIRGRDGWALPISLAGNRAGRRGISACLRPASRP